MYVDMYRSSLFDIMHAYFAYGLTHSQTMTPFDAPGKQAF